MKKQFVLLAVVVAMVCFGAVSGYAAEATVGMVDLRDTVHRVTFPIERGYILGLATDKLVKPAEIAAVHFHSDRVGWVDLTTATGRYSKKKNLAIVRHTANNDEGLWAVSLKSGDFVWFNLDMWEFKGKRARKIVNPDDPNDVKIRYGVYRKETVVFDKEKLTITVKFNSNLLGGMTERGLNPAQTVKVIWSSDLVGWVDLSTVFGEMFLDEKGNYVAVLEGIPDWDQGLLSVELLDGSVHWLNVDAWLYKGADVQILQADNGVRLEYKLN